MIGKCKLEGGYHLAQSEKSCLQFLRKKNPHIIKKKKKIVAKNILTASTMCS